uniref:glycoside hydrolase domain-containing protein n=1 Tax=Segatella baroniae TaxID=305719 RepID=UPI00192E47ED|nr:glycoside hydrolase domain-containing protein [Segatella baroniae]
MTPANWLVESSGIPFGLMGDMLYRGGNRWLGMQYGMAVRYPWFMEGVDCDPRPIWKIWDEFGIEHSYHRNRKKQAILLFFSITFSNLRRFLTAHAVELR